ncbi:MAG: endonuclease NucS [Candidatus Nanoarchaeia archaeon]
MEHLVKFEEAIAKNHSIILNAKCEVWYSGQVESYLPLGDRMILIKEDGVMVVHQPSGNNPINYLKPGSTYSMTQQDGSIFLNGTNIKLKEYMDVKIQSIHFLHSHKMEDGQSIRVAGTEEDMADMIMEQPELIEKGFKPVSREEQTKFGYIDVLGKDKNGILTIVECKRNQADFKAIEQLNRYVEKVKESKGIKEIRGIIAAPKIQSGAELLLKDKGFKFVSVKPPKHLQRFNRNQKTLDIF